MPHGIYNFYASNYGLFPHHITFRYNRNYRLRIHEHPITPANLFTASYRRASPPPFRLRRHSHRHKSMFYDLQPRATLARAAIPQATTTAPPR